jgi:penicillin-binding protein 1A
VGIDQVVETARLAGIRSKLPKTLSLALGSAAISPLELAGAYGTFARGGVNIVPWAVRRIEDWNGHTLISYAPIISRAFPMEPVCWLVDVLKDVVGYGTGTQAKLLDRPVAGKTGTADKSRDIWFVGFTSDMVTAVWGGNDQNLPIVGHNVTGGSVMARVWRDYNRDYYAKSHLPPDQLIVTGSYGSSVTAGRTYKRPTSIQAPQQTDEASGQIEATQNTPRLPTGTSQSHKGVTEYTWGR